MRATLKKSIKRLFLTTVIAALLVTTATVAYASSIYHMRTDEITGETFWLSCGSSAGNYFALCPPGGGTCTVDQGAAQQEANYQCARRGHGGGPAVEEGPQ